MSLTTEDQGKLSIVEARIKKHEQDIIEHQNAYETWSQKKADIISEWGKDLSIKYTILGKSIDTIAKDIIARLKFLGVAEGAESWIYKNLPSEYKGNYTREQMLYEIFEQKDKKPNVDKSTLAAEKKWETLDTKGKKEYIEELDHARRTLTKKAEEEGIDLTKPKEGPRETQRKPPENQQGPSLFSEELDRCAAVIRKLYDGMCEIRDKARVYKILDPERDKLMTQEFADTVTDGIFGTLQWYFVPAKDDKWSIGHMRWMEVLVDRIEQSKHAAGKMNEDYVTDPMTGNVMYDKKGHPIKRFISRERVGDAEKPTFQTSVDMIRCIKGLAWLEYWIEKDIGGYRRHRKWLLHDYFSETAFGSAASGGPDLKYSEEELAADALREAEEEEDNKGLSYQETVNIREKMVDEGLMTKERKDEIED